MTDQPNAATFSEAIPTLIERHFSHLVDGSGLSVEVVRERGYRSVLGKKQLADVGFSKSQQRPPGLLLPVHSPDGSQPFSVYRPDYPRTGKRDKVLKYEFPRGQSLRIDVPPRCLPQLKNPAEPLWLTEGQKKADALAAHDLCAAALLGVWGFKGKNDLGGVALLADFDYIALNGRELNVVFDSDIMNKQNVQAALDRLTEHLGRSGAIVRAVYLPGEGEGKTGVDDFLLSHSVEELKALAGQPRPAKVAKPPQVELLDSAPPQLRRPLALIDGRAYAASWLWTRTTIAEEIKGASIVRHNPPIAKSQRELFVIRDDGLVFGPGADHPLGALDLEIHLSEVPRDDRLWSAPSVKAFRSGRRPNAADVLRRVATIYDTFIDFSRSFAEQSVMCELSACASLTTWFTPAFSVIGYPYPNGERGSGKTHFVTCWAETSFLGEVLLASGSFAALRDLADYGAALAFDDAEDLADPRRSDPDKRALLLAGNRQGARIPLKEPAPNGRWQTRWVNAFCPRAFTAISLPDPVLASRSILYPLVRTTDRVKANRDPADRRRWPCDYTKLEDDLWATALTLLRRAQGVWDEMEADDEIVGREYEPWRAILAVARLFESQGVDGLEERMRTAMRSYQREKADAFDGDRTTLVIRALLRLVDTSDALDTSDRPTETIRYSASDLAGKMRMLAAEVEIECEWVSPSAVGRILRSLRIKKGRESTSKRTRYWEVFPEEIASLAKAYGLLIDGPVACGSGTGNDYVDHASEASEASEVSDQPDAASKIEAWERTIA